MSKTRQIYEFIRQNQNTYSVGALSRLLGVARSGYYEWLRAGAPIGAAASIVTFQPFARNLPRSRRHIWRKPCVLCGNLDY